MDSKAQIPRRNLTEIAEALRVAKDKGGKCTLLVGAGCSLTAGIPLSNTIISDICSKFPHSYARAQKKSNPPGYGLCMRELSPGQRRDLLKGYIDSAVINWAHIGLAQLVKHGCVDRILTTNFDPLIARACALANEFPAVYDLTASTYLRPEELPDRAVFHLHGQRNGFVLLNETAELERHADQLKPVFAHAREGRVWVVVGYSGENDPLFRLIRDVERYEYDLFWVDIKEEPLPGIADFFSDERRTFYVHEPRGADIFFMALAHELEAWPPIFVDRPFEHLRQQLQAITKPDHDVTGRQIDWLQQAREKIDKAEACLAEKATDTVQDDIGKVQAAFLEGGSDKAMAVSKTDQLKAELLLSEGNDLHNKATAIATNDLATARALWQQAGERYAQALAIKPDMYEAAYNWGIVLDNEASVVAPIDLDAARALWQQAGEHYAQALATKPDKHEAASNWGSALDNEARVVAPLDLAAARALWQQASERYALALSIKPDKHEAANNWGIALANEARVVAPLDLKAARTLWQQAGEHYAQALAIKPNKHEAANNWGIALANEARVVAPLDLKAARALWQQAGEHYAQALAIKPDNHKAANDWGIAYLWEYQATKGLDPTAGRALLALAEKKARQAEEIRPGSGAYNLACLAAIHGRVGESLDWLASRQRHGTLPSADHMRSDHDFDAIRDSPEFIAWWRQTFGPEEPIV